MESSRRKQPDVRAVIIPAVIIFGVAAFGLFVSSCMAESANEDASIDAPSVVLRDKDQNDMLIDLIAHYRVVDPDQFRRTLHTENNARSRLGDIVLSNLRDELAGRTRAEILGDHGIADGTPIEINDQVIQSVRDSVEKRTADLKLGIEITELAATATYHSN